MNLEHTQYKCTHLTYINCCREVHILHLEHTKKSFLNNMHQ